MKKNWKQKWKSLKWKEKWNKERNKNSGFFRSRLLLPIFCMMFLFGGCSGEELANVDWEAVESELAALEEEVLVSEEDGYEEQYGEFAENSEPGKEDEGNSKSDFSEKLREMEGKNISDSDEKNISESLEKNDAEAYEKTYEVVDEPVEKNENLNAPIDKEGSYTTMEDVSLYLYTYDELPENFITKKEARELGWEGGSLEPYAPGMCIGGDYFGNREGLLPEEKGRDYYECDIDTLGARNRGAKRIVYSDDGLIYYTDDHYESFVLLYGEE